MIHIKSEKEIELMRKSADILKLVLKAIEKEIKPGVTTNHLNDIAEQVIKENNAIASFKGESCPYRGGKPFKHAICTSINDEIIHGIPSNRVLKNNDMICIDLGVYKDGYHSDAGRTYYLGTDKSYIKFKDVAKQAFFEGIKYAKVGYRIGDISYAIQEYVYKNGYTLLKEFEGHGIGKNMHEDPSVPNIGKKGMGPRLEKGMAIAIEPMICYGKSDIYVKDDKWTIATKDEKVTAYYENTIIITENEAEILTF